MARYQKEDRKGLVQIRPSASPTNAYVRPEEAPRMVGDTGLAQLASALQGVQPTLTQFLVNEEGRTDAAAYQEGTRQKNANAMMNYEEAVKKGLPLSDNPFFRKAWKEQEGSVAADKFNTALTAAMVHPDFAFASSKDEDESSRLFDEFRANWMKENGIVDADPVMAESFHRKAQNYETNLRAHQAKLIGNRIVDDVVNNTYQEMLGIYDDGFTKKLPAAAIAAGLDVSIQTLKRTGMDPKTLNGILMDAAYQQGLEEKSMEPFNVLNHVATGGGFVGKTKEATVMRDQLQRMLNAQREADDDNAWKNYNREREIMVHQMHQSLYGYLGEMQRTGQTMDSDHVREQLITLGKIHPGSAQDFERIIAESNKFTWKDNPDIEAHLTDLLIDQKLTRKDITHALSRKDITPETARIFESEMGQLEDEADSSFNKKLAKKKALDVKGLGPFQEMFDGIKTLYGAADGVDLGPVKAAAYKKARFAAYRLAQQYVDANPLAPTTDDVSEGERIFKQVTGKTLTDIMTGPVNVTDLTKNTPLPNFDPANPGAQRRATEGQQTIPGAPDNDAISAFKFFTGPDAEKQWGTAKDEFLEVFEADGKVEQTRIGQIMKTFGLDPKNPDHLQMFIAGQDGLYVNLPKLRHQ